MKKFILNIFLFLTPIIVLLIIEGLLPSTFFAFRTWESISFATRVPHYSSFYPNSVTLMNANGDLCHHTDKAIVKSEFWITDKLGFRNNEFVDEADILFIGDSFIAGSGLSQNELVSNKVKSKSNKKIYNMSPSSISQFDYFLKIGVIKKPKIIIFSKVERNIPEPIISIKESFIEKMASKVFSFYNINVFIDKAFKLSSIDWLQARISKSKGYGIPSKVNSNMFFFQGANQKHNEGDLQTTLINLKSYKKYCDSLNIKFIFMPMPDKETVYYELVPFLEQPNYLFKLDSILKNEGISTINTLKIYNDYRKNNMNLLYHLDDTHWNSNATELISNEIVRMVNKKNQDDYQGYMQ